MVETKLTVTEKNGVEARLAAQLVNLSSTFSSCITIEYKEKAVNLKSIMGVMSLAMPEGAIIKVVADGEDEQEAIKEVEKLLHG